MFHVKQPPRILCFLYYIATPIRQGGYNLARNAGGCPQPESAAIGTTRFKSRKFSVETRATADGDFDVVTHPGAAVILPVTEDGRIILIRNQRHAVGETLLELPAGTREPPEPTIETARRELREETGYSAGRLEPLVSYYTAPGFCNEFIDAFVATGLTPGPTAHEATERITIQPMRTDELHDAIRQGRVRDAKTIATFLYYERYAERTPSA